MMEKQWKCEHCGYVWQGETPPNHCPNCGHPKDEFTQNKFEDEAE